MSIPAIVTRLQKVHEGLKTISSLQRFKDMSEKRTKPCTCAHHRSPSRSRCPRKCSSHGNRDKSVHCSCKERPRLCLCRRTSDDQSITESSKRLDADEDSKSHSDYPTLADRKKAVVDKAETENLDDRVGQELPTGIASNDRIARTASRFDPGNGDGKPDAVPDSNGIAVASQTFDTVDRSKESGSVRVNVESMDSEQMYKELMAEKERNRELEEKLEKVNCSLKCLKSESEEQAACLKDALEKAKIQTKLASRSRNLAVDLAKQSRDQIDLVKASRDEVLSQMNVVNSHNSKLQCECDELRSKLREISENEEKRCAEVDDKVNRIQCAVKQKEMALASEKSELEETVAELTRLAKVQQKRICDLTSICAKQRSALQEHENCVAAKLAQLSEAENRIESINCRCGSMDDEIEYLKCCLTEQAEARDKLQKAFDERQDNCNCELQIKDKIIADQVETIKKLKKLLQDSEKMAHQAAREFESLRDELRCLKQSNKSLRLALDEAEAQMSDECEMECCERCLTLEAQLRGLSEQKQKALIAAKCAAEKLCESTTNYQRQLDCEKQHRIFVVDLLQRKDTEIELLKNEVRHSKQFGGRRWNDYNQ